MHFRHNLLFPIIIALALWTTTNAAADHLEQCLALVGLPNKAAFLQFDRELRAALSSQKTSALALLMEFPLRVNYPDGARTLLVDAATLQLRYSEIITTAVRDSVLAQATEQISCNASGLMYGSGQVWIQVQSEGDFRSFVVAAINVPSAVIPRGVGAWPLKEPKIAFSGTSETYRVIVEEDGSAIRLRAWAKSSSVDERPTIESFSGKANIEGTGPCAYPSWTFLKDDIEYIISEIGCTDSEPPTGARGTFDTVLNGTRRREWCY